MAHGNGKPTLPETQTGPPAKVALLPEAPEWLEWLTREPEEPEPDSSSLPEEAYEVRDEITLRKEVAGVTFRLRGFKDGASITPATWLIDGVLPAQGISMLFAPAGLGKTWVVDDWAVRIASGTPWLGRPAQSGGVLYVAAEGAYTIPVRTFAAKVNIGLHRKLPIFTVAEPIVFNEESTHPEILAELVREQFHRWRFPPVALVVVDTYTACLQGSANDDDVAANFTRGLRRFLRKLAPPGCPVPGGLVVHHPGLADGERPRGSSAFTGDVDCGMLLEEVKPVEELSGGPEGEPSDDRRSRVLILHCAKPPRQGVAFPDIPLRLEYTVLQDDEGRPVEVGGEMLTALLVQPVDGSVQRRSRRDVMAEQRLARDLRAIDALKPDRILNSEEWRLQSEVSSRRGWETTRDALVASGKVVRLEPLPGKTRPRYALSPTSRTTPTGR